MITYQWKTREEFTEYEELMFQLRRELFNYTKNMNGKRYYYMLYKNNKLYL